MPNVENSILHVALINLAGCILSIIIGIVNDNGGEAMGHIFIGLCITGALTIIILLAILTFWRKRAFKNGNVTLLALILFVVGLGEMSLINVLSLW